ncbi:MAG: T9SS type A sorting domain-containing protein [Bacteroidia bacterium]|nr:T9SS type A sorting domain-containing protein [Bacteroidia bacterium]
MKHYLHNLYILILVTIIHDSLVSQIDSSNRKVIHFTNNEFVRNINPNHWDTGLLYLGSDSLIMKFMDNKDDTIITNSILFRDVLYGIVKNSLFRDTNSSLKKTNLDNLFIEAHNLYNDSNIIPIGVINVEFNIIKKSAIDSGYISINNNDYLTENTDNIQNIYDKRRVCLIAPLILLIDKENISFKLKRRFIFQNTNDTITLVSSNGFNYKENNSIYVDRDKVFRLINNNLTNNSYKFQVIKISHLSDDYEFYVGGYSNDPDDLVGKATIRYGCGNNSKTVKKPFIFVEGFDPGMNAGQLNNFGLLNWSIFSNWDNQDLGDLDKDGILDYQNLQKGKILVNKLVDEGFDVIYLEFKNSTRDIEENVRVLETLLLYIDQTKSSKHQIILAGGSMGGLITKLAAYKFNTVWKKNGIRAWITFDSPHYGANIPLGDQYFVKFFGEGLGSDAEAEWAKKVLNTPAAQQMLISHYLDDYGGRAYNGNNILGNINYPLYIRKRIAISNGSNKGVNGNQGFGWGTLMVDMLSSCKPSHIIKYLEARGRAKIWAVPDNDNTFYIIFDAQKQECTFWTILESMKVYSINSSAVDNAPGGMRYTNKSLVYKGGTAYHPNHCFIPTLSSLGFDKGNLWVFGYSSTPTFYYNIRSNFFLNPQFNFLPNSNILYLKNPNYTTTLFNILYAPDDNQQHVEITDDNINFIMNEISPFDLYLQNEVYPNPNFSNEEDVFEARNTITAGKNVTSKTSVGDFVVNPGADITFRAGDKIVLKDGFKAKEGSHFRAYIDPFPCVPSNRLSQSEENANNETKEKNFSNNVVMMNQNETNYYVNNGRKQYFLLLPNPANTSVFIQSAINIQSIILQDISGKILLQKAFKGETSVTLDISNIPNGLYFVQIHTEQGVVTEKLVVQH